MDRRHFFKKIMGGSAATVTSLTVLNSCNPNGGNDDKTKTPEEKRFPDDCTDLSGVDETNLKRREALGYVDKTPVDGSHCSNCKLYIPPKNGEKSGGCMLFAGPVCEDGYCIQYEAIDG